MSDEQEVLDPPTDQQQDQQPTDDQQQQAAPVAQFDYRAMHVEGMRERARLEAEIEALKRTPAAPQTQQSAPSVSDDDIRNNPAEAISRIIDTRLRETLAQQMAPMQEMTQAFRTQSAISNAEQAVFRDMPHLGVITQDPAAIALVRQRAAANGPPTKASYQEALFATIGQYAAANLLPGAAPVTQQAPAPQAPAPARAPTGRAPASAAPRLTEAEKTAMRKARLDPTKPDDVAEFQRLISDDPYDVR